MKKKVIILFALLSIFIFLNPAFAQETETLTLQGKADFNWLDMSQIERDTIIDNYKKIIFGDDTVYKYKRKDFRTLHKDYLKDENNKTHYLEAQEGITETKDYR